MSACACVHWLSSCSRHVTLVVILCHLPEKRRNTDLEFNGPVYLCHIEQVNLPTHFSWAGLVL